MVSERYAHDMRKVNQGAGKHWFIHIQHTKSEFRSQEERPTLLTTTSIAVNDKTSFTGVRDYGTSVDSWENEAVEEMRFGGGLEDMDELSDDGLFPHPNSSRERGGLQLNRAEKLPRMAIATDCMTAINERACARPHPIRVKLPSASSIPSRVMMIIANANSASSCPHGKFKLMIVVQHLKTMNEFTAKMLEYNDIEYFAAPMTLNRVSLDRLILHGTTTRKVVTDCRHMQAQGLSLDSENVPSSCTKSNIASILILTCYLKQQGRRTTGRKKAPRTNVNAYMGLNGDITNRVNITVSFAPTRPVGEMLSLMYENHMKTHCGKAFITGSYWPWYTITVAPKLAEDL
ncbi:uncharacterized protein BT62DRAFT_993113 [Guyanagaster necrorhizus]|uniref:Uncharacterized protein n=1 Tax=Guyanagaster necrorhizus TaxID=856835 RepID=A0A9P7VWL8_9AGAR|nr:uncharacterized protein BT62DRAFT_993113 [Guyanagaster necrorhizus MCA 3950]KAG7448299.1 hypothetical protein BT62DRAFT_993113 [Guyanagaster necrorhizus MCA 3950]